MISASRLKRASACVSRDQMPSEHLDRDPASQARVLGLEHQAHATLVEYGEDPIGPPQSLADERMALVIGNGRRRRHVFQYERKPR